ncbi:NUDIX domain-containing protein, partial [Leuconostoc mesenteroides]
MNYIKDIRSLVGNQNIILNFAGGVLVNNKNEILLQRRSDSKLWGLPGGAMELGETGQKTCEREFLEETGLQVNVKSLLGFTTNFQVTYPNGNQAQCVVIQYIV